MSKLILTLISTSLLAVAIFMFLGLPRPTTEASKYDPTITPSPTPTAVLGASTRAQSILLLTINEHRKNNGLKPLIYSQKYSNVAYRRAKYLKDRNLWSHADFQWFVDTQSGAISGKIYGENLAKDFKSDREIFEGFLISPPHNVEMLRTFYNKVGIGRYKNYVVVFFAEE